MGFEPTASTLARLRSTPELHPHLRSKSERHGVLEGFKNEIKSEMAESIRLQFNVFLGAIPRAILIFSTTSLRGSFVL